MHTLDYTRREKNLKIIGIDPACEISATVTLGFDGNVWPIYMSKEEKPKNPKPVEMGVGDAVLYRGV